MDSWIFYIFYKNIIDHVVKAWIIGTTIEAENAKIKKDEYDDLEPEYLEIKNDIVSLETEKMSLRTSLRMRMQNWDGSLRRMPVWCWECQTQG